MSDIPICLSCKQEMQLDKDFGISNKKRRRGSRYRIRRFKCNLCNIVDTLFGEKGSDNYHQYMAEEDIKKQHKEESLQEKSLRNKN